MLESEAITMTAEVRGADQAFTKGDLAFPQPRDWLAGIPPLRPALVAVGQDGPECYTAIGGARVIWPTVTSSVAGASCTRRMPKKSVDAQSPWRTSAY